MSHSKIQGAYPEEFTYVGIDLPTPDDDRYLITLESESCDPFFTTAQARELAAAIIAKADEADRAAATPKLEVVK